MSADLLLSAAQFAESLPYLFEIRVVRLEAPAHTAESTPALTNQNDTLTLTA